MMNGLFEFHGIGQGLFYTGKIGNCFNFVYDCGTLYKKDRPLLETAIENAFNSKGQKHKPIIDVLFISHFHKDHISGLPKLFDTYDIKNVYMPDYSPEELFLNCISECNSEDNNEIFNIFENPLKYFSDNSVENIMIIKSDIDDISNQEKTPSDNQSFERLFNNDIFSVDGNIIYDHNLNATNIFIGNSLSLSVNISPNWIFKMYQNRTLEQSKRIKDKINDLIDTYKEKYGFYNIKNALQDEDFIKSARNVYKTVLSDINQSSLILRHHPDKYNTIKIVPFHYKYCDCRFCCDDCASCELYNSDSTLLTGDIDLKSLSYDDKKLKNIIFDGNHKIQFFQLPHHGSSHNTSIDIIYKYFDYNMIFICSYGLNNRFRHPNPYLLDKIISINLNSISHVVENESFTYQINVEY